MLRDAANSKGPWLNAGRTADEAIHSFNSDIDKLTPQAKIPVVSVILEFDEGCHPFASSRIWMKPEVSNG